MCIRDSYHLLPHNGYAGLSQLPPASQARSGDYVLILSPLAAVAYNTAQRVLEGGKQRLPAELLYAAPVGALFRVGGD